MNSDQAAQYAANLSALSARHAAMLDEYVAPPFGERTMRASRIGPTISAPGLAPVAHTASLESELEVVQQSLAMTPPLLEVQDGLWVPTGKGLLHAGRQTSEPLQFRDMAGPEIIPVDQWAKWLADQAEPPSVKAFCPYVFNQGSVGSCSSESSNASLCQVEVFSGLPPTLFNPYATYFYVSGGRDSGSTLEDNIASLQTRGAFPESVWPRSNGWRSRPSAEALAEAKKHRLGELVRVRNQAEMGSRLIQRRSVYYWYDSHAVLAVGLLSTSMFEYLNSWSENWSNRGYGTMSFRSVSYNGFYSFGSAVGG